VDLEREGPQRRVALGRVVCLFTETFVSFSCVQGDPLARLVAHLGSRCKQKLVQMCLRLSQCSALEWQFVLQKRQRHLGALQTLTFWRVPVRTHVFMPFHWVRSFAGPTRDIYKCWQPNVCFTVSIHSVFWVSPMSSRHSGGEIKASPMVRFPLRSVSGARALYRRWQSNVCSPPNVQFFSSESLDFSP